MKIHLYHYHYYNRQFYKNNIKYTIIIQRSTKTITALLGFGRKNSRRVINLGIDLGIAIRVHNFWHFCCLLKGLRCSIGFVRSCGNSCNSLNKILYLYLYKMSNKHLVSDNYISYLIIIIIKNDRHCGNTRLFFDSYRNCLTFDILFSCGSSSSCSCSCIGFSSFSFSFSFRCSCSCGRSCRCCGLNKIILIECKF